VHKELLCTTNCSLKIRHHSHKHKQVVHLESHISFIGKKKKIIWAVGAVGAVKTKRVSPADTQRSS
jgi:hypothetical protein